MISPKLDSLRVFSAIVHLFLIYYYTLRLNQLQNCLLLLTLTFCVSDMSRTSVIKFHSIVKFLGSEAENLIKRGEQHVEARHVLSYTFDKEAGRCGGMVMRSQKKTPVKVSVSKFVKIDMTINSTILLNFCSFLLYLHITGGFLRNRLERCLL